MKRQTLAGWVSLWLCVCSSMVSAQESDAISVGPHWHVGQTSRYEFWSTRVLDRTMTMGDRKRTSTTRIESDGQTTWQVDRVASDGSATCTMTLNWITATITGPDGKAMKNDSRKHKGAIEPYHKLLKAVVDMPITVEVAADGTVKRVKGVKQIAARFKAGDFPLEDRDFIESATTLAILAGAPPTLKVGQSWKTVYDWSHEMGTIEQAFTYKLDSVEEIEGIALATVTGTAKLKLNVDRSEIPSDAPPMSFKLSQGRATDQVMFDLHRHETVGRNNTEDYVVTTRITLPQGQGTIVQKTDTQVRSQVLRLSEE